MADEKGRRGTWEAPRWLRTTFLVVLGVAVVSVLVLALRPQPVPVDLATVDLGTVEVAVEEDGRTRVRDRYEVSAPVAGSLRRITLRPGDLVERGDVLARLDGPEASLADPRTEAQFRTRLQAAQAGVERARAMEQAAQAGTVEAREEVRRQEVLLAQSGGSESALERARALLRAREAEARSAGFAVQAAEGEVEDLRLALARPGAEAGAGLELRAPTDGVVLGVHRESGGTVGPGEPLVAVGDPSRLEVVVDLLSADAVRVATGASAVIRRWGGDDVEALVRRVEPAGFTRISALGIEEQRVNVILDPVGDPADWARLGDGFRVEVRILVERVEGVVRAPTGAVFRSGDGWAVFGTDGGRIRLTPVEVGRRSQAVVEVLSGLDEKDRVVVYPSDRVEDGVRYRERR
jgi:HlyD family secretion protein